MRHFEWLSTQCPVRIMAGGEVDVRGCYLTMAVAHILNLDKATLAEHAGLVSYIQQCQVSFWDAPLPVTIPIICTCSAS